MGNVGFILTCFDENGSQGSNRNTLVNVEKKLVLIFWKSVVQSIDHVNKIMIQVGILRLLLSHSVFTDWGCWVRSALA